MSAHQKKIEDLDLGNSFESDDSSERREVADTQQRERRVIPRISVPSLQISLGHLRLICKVWAVFSAGFIAALVASNFYTTQANWSRTSFYCVIAATVWIATDQLRRAINFFMFSHSQMKLALVVERAMALIFIVSVIGMIFGVVHLLSVFS